MIKFLIEKTNFNLEFSTWTFIKEYLKHKNIEYTEIEPGDIDTIVKKTLSKVNEFESVS